MKWKGSKELKEGRWKGEKGDKGMTFVRMKIG